MRFELSCRWFSIRMLEVCLARTIYRLFRRTSPASFPRRGNTTVVVGRKPTDPNGPSTSSNRPRRGRTDAMERELCNPFRVEFFFSRVTSIRTLPHTATIVWPFSGPKRDQDKTPIGIRHWVLTPLAWTLNTYDVGGSG